ncbi:esterase-like activity of phytase family protein [Thiomicrorhabdus sp.]|uniref:esterase-like activity of phytase family protein n=1 Tax=Thiomicrorhabdus sp. TaxID=2039724 RepID=UPI0029C8B473|nr:esterase-like activity of phytase family protein [Thiomicrorhabdus sp.]
MLKKTLLASAVLGTLLLTACNDSDSDESLKNAIDTLSTEGASLPYSILRSDLIDADTQQPFEVRNGGFGSAMTAVPGETDQFYALTDRGPNATFTGNYGKGKKFPTPDYTPRIGQFKITDKGEIELVKEILLKDRDGKNISGLPNTSALGGTGETPYNADGSPVLVDPSKAYNDNSASPDYNPLKLDDYGLDGEGLAALDDGTFWVSDEYGPHMVHFDAEGKEIGRINPFAGDARVTIHLPAEFANRRANRGMEGLAITPDQTTLVGIMQSTMYNPNSSVKDLDITRIVTVNLQDGTIGQYLYKQEKPQNSNSEIVAISANEFLIIERDGSFLFGGPDGTDAATPDAQKHVYRIDLRNATDLESVGTQGDFVQDADLGLLMNGSTLEEVVLNNGWDALTTAQIYPVSKELVVDMVSAVEYPHDKMEGLWLIDDQHLGVLNDDDFATWSTSGELTQKMLNDSDIDGNRLYIIKDLDLSPRD